MKRPRGWLHWVLLACLLILFAEYIVLTWVAPRYMIAAIQRVLGGKLVIDHAQLSLPLTTRLTGVHFALNTPQAALTVPKALIRPGRLFFPSRTLEVASLELERPLLRITRTKAGTILWPSLSVSGVSKIPQSSRFARLAAMLSSWDVRVQTIKVVDGTIEYVDEEPVAPFHILFDHLSFVVGPISFPLIDNQPSFALRGALIGHAVQPAPFYCSGWVGFASKELQISCQLEPLTLAVFEPYYQRSPVIRVYRMTLKSTSQWMAKANELEARIQLEFGNLTEGDLSVHGHTVIDVKKLTASGEPRLTGEIHLNGPLDAPQKWSGEFIPGDAPAQKLVAQLLERRVKVLKTPGGVGLRLASANETAMQDIQAVSKEISEALEILATPLVYNVPADVPTPNAAPQVAVIISPETRFMPWISPPPSSSTQTASPTGVGSSSATSP